jgi:curved DNA-binding protein CbpA
MATVDLYDVLNVEPDSSQEEINKAFHKMVKKFHPDKKGANQDLYELIVNAHQILKNKKTRTEYDDLYQLSKKADKEHVSFQGEFEQYKKLQDESHNPNSLREAKMRFEDEFKQLDSKHGFKRSKLDDDPLSKKDTNQMLEDLMLARDQDEIDFKPDSLFVKGKFNNDKFNEAFELMHDTGLDNSKDIIGYQDMPSGFTSFDSGFVDAEYSGVERDIADLYGENEDDIFGYDGQTFGNARFSNKKTKKLSAKEVSELTGKSKSRDYDKRGDKDYAKKLEEMLHEREDDYDPDIDLDINYNTDDITYQFTQDVAGGQVSRVIWDNDESIRERYKKLLELRKEESQ